MRYLSNYKTFNNKKELNEATAAHLKRCRYEMNQTDHDVLLMISRYAVKYAGAAHLKNNTIATTLKKSVRTIQRSIKKLEQLKILQKQSFLRKVKGGFGANILVILNPSVISVLSPREDETNSDTPTVEAVKTEIESSFLKTNRKTQEHKTTYPAERQTLYQQIRSLIDDQKQAREIYAIYRAQALRLLKFDIHSDKKELLESLAIRALTIATKSKSAKNIFGYFDGTLRNLIEQSLFDDAFKDYDVNPMQLCTH